MKKLLYTFLAVSIIFSACKKEEEDTLLYSPGWWTGSYSGGSEGSWNATIASDGNVSGINLTTGMTISGSVTDNGSFSATAGTGSSAINFTGTLNGYDGNGTWDSSGIIGAWELGCKDGCTGNFE